MSYVNLGGRPGGTIFYQDIQYNEKDYIVGTVCSNGEPVKFIIDKEDQGKVVGRSWHKSAGHYISSAENVDGVRKELFLHNLIANRLDFPGKGARETVDHINRNGFDNRKENLRVLSQSEQNMNQCVRGRSITLPSDSGIDPSEIPRHIWYIKAHGAHGDRFAIEFKTEGLTWKTTSSKKVSLRDKLNQAKQILEELYQQFPYLNPFRPEKVEKEVALVKSFDEIIALSNARSLV